MNKIKLNSYFANISTMRIKICLISIVIIFVVIKYWQHHKFHEDRLVAQNYQTMLQAISVSDFVTVKTYGAELLKYSNRTPYPRLAALLLAKVFMLEDNLDEAAIRLNFVVNKKKKDEIWHLANLRLAKVLLLQNKLSDAKKILEIGMTQKKFSGRYQELQGDLLFADHKLMEANKEYQDALKNLPKQVAVPWLDLKITETALEDNV